MGLNRINIEANELTGLSGSARKQVDESLKTINNTPAAPDPAQEAKYKEAWKNLFAVLPRNISYSLIARTFGEPTQPGGPYHNLLPLSASFLGAGLCFSSAHFDFPRQKATFMQGGLYDKTGQEFAPLIEGSLKQTSCSPAEIIAILKDLARIGPPNVPDLLDEIGAHHWQDSYGFAKAYLELATQCAFPKRASGKQKPLADRCRAAVLLLIPADGRSLSPEENALIRKAVSYVMMNLFKQDCDAFFNQLIQDPRIQRQPSYEKMLRDIAQPFLRLPV